MLIRLSVTPHVYTRRNFVSVRSLPRTVGNSSNSVSHDLRDSLVSVMVVVDSSCTRCLVHCRVLREGLELDVETEQSCFHLIGQCSGKEYADRESGDSRILVVVPQVAVCVRQDLNRLTILYSTNDRSG